MITIVDKSSWNNSLCSFNSFDEEIAFAEKEGYSLIPPGEFEGEAFYVSNCGVIKADLLENSCYSQYPLFTKKKSMETFYIHVPTPGISADVQARLFQLGYKWASGEKKIKYTECQYLVPWDDGTICYGDRKDSMEHYKKVTIEELFSPDFPAFSPPRPDVIFPPGEIVPDYSVVISEKGINVVCQTVSFEAFEKLAAAVENYRAARPAA